MCGRGRECQLNAVTGHPECVCVKKCRKHHKLICGSDGVLYSSHCELHRSACLTNQPISIDHSYLCLRRHAGRPFMLAVFLFSLFDCLFVRAFVCVCVCVC